MYVHMLHWCSSKPAGNVLHSNIRHLTLAKAPGTLTLYLAQQARNRQS